VGSATITFENVDGDGFSPSPATSALGNGEYEFRTVYGDYNVTVTGEVNGEEYFYTSPTPVSVHNIVTELKFTIAPYPPPPFMSSEDWEGDTSSWVIVNHPTQLNKWHLGEATHNGTGTHAMYISNDNGATNAYTIAGQSVRAHIYRDMTFPADVANIVLNLDIKVQGESGYDYLRVYMMPTSITPAAANSSITATTRSDPHAEYIIGNTQYNRGTLGTTDVWHNVNINIPAVWAGQVGRLVFTWNNDVSGGNQPPVAIDNLSITHQPANTVPGLATVATPYNAGNLISVDTELRWLPDAFAAPATEFTLYFGETAETLAPESNGPQTSYTPEAPLDYATTYYWKVVPSNSFVPAVDCPVWSFTTIDENTLLVGNGTASMTATPVYIGAGLSVSEMIYTQAELEAAGFTSGSITHISFQASANGVNLASGLNNNWLIYMGTTLQDVFTNTLQSWVPLTNMTQVKRGAISETSLTAYQWVTIALDTPYTYEGNGNLVIFVNEYTPSYAGASSWLGFSATGSRAIYRYAQGTEPFEPEGEVTWNAGNGGNRATTRPNLALTLAPPPMYTVSGGVVYLDEEGVQAMFGGATITFVSAENNVSVTSGDTEDDLGVFVVELLAGEYSVLVTGDVEGVAYAYTSVEPFVVEGDTTGVVFVAEAVPPEPPTTYTVGGVLYLSPEATSGSVAGLTVMLLNNDDDEDSPASVTSNEGGEFSFADVSPGTYTLSISGESGTPYTHDEAIVVEDEDILDLVIVVPTALTEGDVEAVPVVTALRSNYPNPFNPTTTIAFDVAREGRVVVEIYNIKGQRVRVLTDDVYGVGRHSVVWNGDDATGRSVGSGVYFYRMTAGEYRSVRKMLLMK